MKHIIEENLNQIPEIIEDDIEIQGWEKDIYNEKGVCFHCASRWHKSNKCPH